MKDQTNRQSATARTGHWYCDKAHLRWGDKRNLPQVKAYFFQQAKKLGGLFNGKIGFKATNAY